MAFETLKDRIGPIAPIANYTPTVKRDVYPIGEVVAHTADQINKMVEQFSPLTLEERKLKIQNMITQGYIQRKMFEAVKNNDWETFRKLQGHLTSAELEQQAYQKERGVRRAMQEYPVGGKPAAGPKSNIGDVSNGIYSGTTPPKETYAPTVDEIKAKQSRGEALTKDDQFILNLSNEQNKPTTSVELTALPGT
jgi:hypothetical protein